MIAEQSSRCVALWLERPPTETREAIHGERLKLGAADANVLQHVVVKRSQVSEVSGNALLARDGLRSRGEAAPEDPHKGSPPGGVAQTWRSS